MKAYLSGPISTDMSGYVSKFAEAKAVIEAAGNDVMNPAEFGEEYGTDPSMWTKYLCRDLVAMLSECDRIVLLPGWKASRGATLEAYIASVLGFEMFEYIPESEMVDKCERVRIDAEWSVQLAAFLMTPYRRSVNGQF
jgi:hypothetical protein